MSETDHLFLTTLVVGIFSWATTYPWYVDAPIVVLMYLWAWDVHRVSEKP